MRNAARCGLILLEICAIACAGSRDEDSGAYPSGPGPHTVRDVADLVLHDAARDKDLAFRVRIPDGAGPFPVIVWSHGALGSKDNYAVLTEHWASHGYATIQPTHADSRQLGGRIRDVMGLRGWQDRPADVSFILDSLEEIEQQAGLRTGTLERQRIGVGGHSFGAHTAQLIGGARTFTRAGEQSFADARVKAILLLSGQGPGEMLTQDSWRAVRGPMLVMSGTRDGPTRTGQPAEWRRQPYELSPPGDKYLVWVDGLDHGYGGISGARGFRNRRNEDHVRYTQIATLAFWDAYLRESERARRYLASDALISLGGGAIEIERK
jgi:dienelactone hydrolase